jgi:uncharacterized protein YdeI (YjbR/CyaY-like superfamily)
MQRHEIGPERPFVEVSQRLLCKNEHNEYPLWSESGMKTQSRSATELPIHHFHLQQDWSAWLGENHSTSPGVWLRLAKKGADTPSVSYEHAIEIALCFGWIDGQKQAHSEQFWLQKFTRRSNKSVWSKINRDKALTLIKAGKMKPAGLKEIERAKADGRWEAAYDSASNATVPADFQSALDNNARAKKFFGTLDSRNRYAVLFRIQTAKKGRNARQENFTVCADARTTREDASMIDAFGDP